MSNDNMVAVVIDKESDAGNGEPSSALGKLFNAFSSGCNLDCSTNTNLISDDDETVVKQRRLSNEDRAAIVGALESAIRVHSKIPRGEKFFLVERHQLSERSVSAVWKRCKETGLHRNHLHKCGRKPWWTAAHLNKTVDIPLEFKQTI